jgi:hypothetical protein
LSKTKKIEKKHGDFVEKKKKQKEDIKLLDFKNFSRKNLRF